jgi:hypothetical protein
MDLPKKDKYGVNRLSYSQMSTFKKSKDLFYQRYIVGEEFQTNEYIEFGSKVGDALEKNDFSKFSKKEIETLNKVTRLDEFERPVFLKYSEFYIVGYIDTVNSDLTEIIDYKTGGVKKELQYMENSYNQLQIYALGIQQETGSAPKKASVEFIRRKGNLYKGQSLYVGDEEPIKIDVDISSSRLMDVYLDILKTANEINEFYKNNRP